MLPLKENCKIIIVFIILFSLTSPCAASFEDGFGPRRKIESKHFDIYYEPGVDIFSLARQLDINPSDRVLFGKFENRKFSSLEREFAKMLDTLFIQVCDILDMPLYSFRTNIKICRDYEHIKRVYYNLFKKNLKRRSFYVYNLNTVYISAEDFSYAILGHEIAHAIISHYFVVLPSAKIQELLAVYVEHRLRKR